MSLAQLEYFVAVAEEGHIGRAAARLHISQPPLTRQIRSLEDELGAPLFARTPRGMMLLPAGERFLSRAREVLDAVEAARRCVHDPDGHLPAHHGPRRHASATSIRTPGS
ncbi:MAG: LysR family transcriptional regulator [Myxococcales bacterium]|nr:LysR family transcriptional regulator [Myxococcales bacterium]